MLEKMSRNSSRSGSPSHKSDKSRSSSSHRRRRSRTPSIPERSISKGRSHHRSYSRSRSRSPPPLPSRSSPKYSKRRSYTPRSRSRSYSSSRRRRSSYERRRTHSRSPLSLRRRHVGTRERPQECRCLGVFGLSVHTNEQKIQQIFSKFGPIERVQIVFDAKTGKSRGFCFVYYENVEDAKTAKEQLCGIEIDDRRIRVDYSITKRAHTPTPGVYMGKATRLYRDREYHDRSRDEAYSREKMRYRDHYYYRHRTPSPHYRDRRRRHSRSRSYSPRDRERRYYR